MTDRDAVVLKTLRRAIELKLNGNEFLILSYVALHCFSDGWLPVSVNKLTVDLGLSKGTVVTHIKSLEAKGLLYRDMAHPCFPRLCIRHVSAWS